MSRIVPVVLSVWVVLAFSVAGVGGVGATTAADPGSSPATSLSGAPVMAAETNETNDTANTTDGNASVPPGAMIAGAIGVGQAELRGEVENRAFGRSIAAANSNASKARILANESERLTERIQDLENSTAELNRSYEAGNVSFGVYRARLAKLTAQTRMLERLANQSVSSASTIPAAVRRAHGVNVTQLDRLRSHAANMTGKEVSEFARQMGGPRVGHPLGKERGHPGDRPGAGPPDDRPGGAGPGSPGQNTTTEDAPANGSMGSPNGSSPPHDNPPGPPNEGNATRNSTTESDNG